MHLLIVPFCEPRLLALTILTSNFLSLEERRSLVSNLKDKLIIEKQPI